VVTAKILLVEDEFLLREATLEDLRELGFDAVCAAEAAEAWEMLEEDSTIAGLITDIRMPGDWDGWELARQARAARPDLAVIYVSGFSDGTPQPVPGSVFLKKPYRFDDIRDALAQVGAAPKR
jgi:CheY-like chemotaxis protein